MPVLKVKDLPVDFAFIVNSEFSWNKNLDKNTGQIFINLSIKQI